MQRRKVNSITYGAIICALVGVLLVINRQLANFIDIYLFWIIPLPVIIYSIKFDSKQAVIMGVAMMIVAVLTTGFSVTTTFYVAASIIAGLVYGYGVNTGKGAGFLIGSVIVVSLIVMVVSTFLFSAAFGYNFTEEIRLLKEAMVAIIGEEAIAASPVLARIFTDNFFFQLYIISCVLSSVLEGVLVHLLSYLVLRRLKMELPPMKPISEIYAPKWVKLFVFASLFASIVAQFTSITQYDNIILPMSMIAQIICFLFGYIFMLTVLTLKFKDRRKVSMITMLVLLLFVFTAPALVYLGIFDMFSNLRKRLLLQGGNTNVHEDKHS